VNPIVLATLRPFASAHILEPAQVEDDGIAARRAFVEPRQHVGNVFVREAVKAVPPHAAVGDCLGQRERMRHRRRAAVERRVEARDLRQLR
jgi:hypothetical protein